MQRFKEKKMMCEEKQAQMSWHTYAELYSPDGTQGPNMWVGQNKNDGSDWSVWEEQASNSTLFKKTYWSITQGVWTPLFYFLY